MCSDYIRKIHQALMIGTEKIIMVHKSMLSKDDISLINQLEEIYHKTVKLSTLQEIMNNKDINVCIIE